MFTHLHVHSSYSLLDGMCDIKKLVEYVGSIGQEAVAITDHGTLHAPVKFYNACQEYEEKTGKKIKPIYGLEAYITVSIKDNVFVKEQVEEAKKIKKALKAKEKKLFNTPLKIKDYYNYLAQTNEEYYGNSTKEFTEDVDEGSVEDYKYGLSHLVLIAKNNDGFNNLLELASISQLEGFYNRPRLDHNLLKKYGKNLIALSACRAGEIPRLIFRNREDLAIKLIEEYKLYFDEFYLELQPPVVPEQEYLNNVLIRLAEETKTPLVVTTDAHYIKESDSTAHEDLMKMQTGGRFWFKEKCYFIHTEEEIKNYNFPEEAIENTNLIANKCNVELDFSQKLPQIEAPSGYNNEEYLRKISIENLNKYLSNNLELNIKEYYDRLNFELEVITSKKLQDYLLIIADIINYGKDNGILIGPGRGSSGGSLICMCLGITNIDPIKYNLLFERKYCAH